jgi:three-Cys-motif partner protein
LEVLVAAEQDVIGSWTEVKLEILGEYAVPYSTILAANHFHHLYIDAFAAGGSHISRATGEVVPGSPLIALSTKPPFREYHFIDKNPARVEQLKQYTADRSDVFVHQGDCNGILLSDVFPRARYEERRRALCLLDPYNINLSWDVVATAGHMKSIEIFVNFMVMDMNMNVLLRDLSRADDSQIARMDRFWGDRSWHETAYEVSWQGRLFDGPEEIKVKVEDANEKIAEAYRKRLIDLAGFGYAPRPLRFVNSLGRTIYYRFFASPNKAGEKIVGDIFGKYRKKQGL